MNTTHRARRKQMHLPDLPTEIWLEILRLSTWVEGLLDPVNGFELSPSSARAQKRGYRESLITKRYIVRVCKQWYDWAIPYLYESIYLGRGRSVHALRDALIKPDYKHFSSDNVHSLGWLVKRLDLAMRDMGKEDDVYQEEVECISDISKCLPNLKILQVSISSQSYYRGYGEKFPSSVLQSLANTCGLGLEAIFWAHSHLCPSTSDWQTFLGKTINLRTLHHPRLSTTDSEPFIRLKSLESIFIQHGFPKGDLPALRRLTVDVAPDSSWDYIIGAYGSKLEVIQLNLDSLSAVLPALSLLSASCPSLGRLNLSVKSWEYQAGSDEVTFPTTIRILGLQNAIEKASVRCYKSLFETLVHLQAGSALDYIQLMDRGNVEDLSKKPEVLAMGLKMLAGRGRELRDHTGVVMSV